MIKTNSKQKIQYFIKNTFYFKFNQKFSHVKLVSISNYCIFNFNCFASGVARGAASGPQLAGPLQRTREGDRVHASAGERSRDAARAAARAAVRARRGRTHQRPGRRLRVCARRLSRILLTCTIHCSLFIASLPFPQIVTQKSREIRSGPTHAMPSYNTNTSAVQ